MLLPTIQVHHPESLAQALELKAELGADARWWAGGTDLVPNLKWGMEGARCFISLAKLDQLRSCTPLRLGAGLRLVDLERHPELNETHPALCSATRKVASPLLRNQATLGGNLLLDTRCHYVNQSSFWRHSQGYCLKADGGPQCLVVPGQDRCYATFSGDLAPLLLVLGAQVELATAQGTRTLPLSELYLDDGIARSTLTDDELLTAVLLPEDSHSWQASYKKLRLRSTIDFPSAGIAMALQQEEGVLTALRVAHTAIASRPELLPDMDQLLGQPLNAELAARLEVLVQERIQPYKNVPLPPAYRKTWMGVEARRLLLDLAGI